jgi:hypothetical protein
LDVLPHLADASIHLSVYSPPFCGLYHYSSSEHDMSNCRTREEFLLHYAFLVSEIARVTMPGRISAVHVMDIPNGGGTLYDFPGDVVRVHQNHGMDYIARHAVWKEPLGVRMRTMAQGLAHRQVVEDSSLCDVAGADYLLLFRKRGQNPIPITHPTGLLSYAGARKMPAELLQYRGHEGHQTENSFSHWIWRQYASAFWDDVRVDRVLPFRDAREPDDEKHVHPLQLDVIERIITLRSNPGEVVLTPFMGVGSEVYMATRLGRKAIGIELKASYFKQAKLNVVHGVEDLEKEQAPLFADVHHVDEMEIVKSRTLARNTWKPKKRRSA